MPCLTIKGMLDPMLCCNAIGVPVKYYPLRQELLSNYQQWFLTHTTDLKFIPDLKSRLALFGQIKYYAPPEDYQRSFLLPLPAPPLQRKVETNPDGVIQASLPIQKNPVELDKTLSLKQYLLPPASLPLPTPISQLSVLEHRISEQTLPVGWELRCDGEGHKYYVDHNTGTTQWECPNDGGILAPQAGNDAILPPGWEKKETDEGQTYYVDHNTNETLWNLPEWVSSGNKDDLNSYLKEVMGVNPTETV